MRQPAQCREPGGTSQGPSATRPKIKIMMSIVIMLSIKTMISIMTMMSIKTRMSIMTRMSIKIMMAAGISHYVLQETKK